MNTGTDQWNIVYGEMLVNPRQIPKRMTKIWDDPPTYAPRLVPIVVSFAKTSPMRVPSFA